MVSRVCNALGCSTDDDDDRVLVTVKEVLVEEKNRPVMKNESSQRIIKSRIQSCKRKRTTSHSAGNVKLESESSSRWSPAMVQAFRVQLSLGTKFPSAIKLLFKSHLKGHKGFLLSLPHSFCRLHLPKDENLTLVDENEEKFEVNYVSKFRRFGFAGWKKFAVSHKLQERDVLVFHLLQPTKLKVYVIRGDDSSLLEQDGQSILKSPDLSNQSQELKAFEGYELKRVKLPSAERKVNTPAMVKANCIDLSKCLSFNEVNSPAMIQARRVQLILGNKSPSFMKFMFKSHLEGNAKVRLPLSFCKVHLLEDETITLEDENEKKFEVKYFSQATRFGAGWKNFVTSHKLRERDVLVFHLIEPTKFKVYLIRGDDSTLTEQDGQGILKSPDLANQSQEFQIFEGSEPKRVKLPSAGKVKLERKLNSPAMVEANCIQLAKSLNFCEVNSPAMIEALRVHLSLGNKSPSFTKLMFKSHLEHRAIMRLPVSFCRLHLLEDETIILEDENEKKFEVKYISKPMSFGAGGWKKFVASHKLRERDILVFHLVKPTKWKVYIIRADDHVNLKSSPSKPNKQDTLELSSPANPSKQLRKFKDFESNHINVISIDDDEVNVHRSLIQQNKQGSSDLKTFAEFQLEIRSVFLESEIDENTLKKYYKLCHSKNNDLHNKTLNLNRKLVAGIIGETVEIAAAVKASDIFTPTEKLEQWENSLRSFKLLGMKIEFLVNRVNQLLKLRVGFEGTRCAEEMKILEAKRVELKEAYEKVNIDVKNLKSKAEMYDGGKFQQVVDSPW